MSLKGIKSFDASNDRGRWQKELFMIIENKYVDKYASTAEGLALILK